jgi:hypothetical protein
MSTIPPEPSGSQPSYQPPAPGASAPPPAYAPAPGYDAAPPAAYAAGPGTKPKGPSTLGIVAFVASLAAVIIGSILAFMAGQSLGSVVEYSGSSTVDVETLPADAQQALATGGLLSVAAFGIFGILALWGFIQGIVATVKNRGRGWGITAIVLAVIGGGFVAMFYGFGFAAGAAPYLS